MGCGLGQILATILTGWQVWGGGSRPVFVRAINQSARKSSYLWSQKEQMLKVQAEKWNLGHTSSPGCLRRKIAMALQDAEDTWDQIWFRAMSGNRFCTSLWGSLETNETVMGHHVGILGLRKWWPTEWVSKKTNDISDKVAAGTD